MKFVLALVFCVVVLSHALPPPPSPRVVVGVYGSDSSCGTLTSLQPATASGNCTTTPIFNPSSPEFFLVSIDPFNPTNFRYFFDCGSLAQCNDGDCYAQGKSSFGTCFPLVNSSSEAQSIDQQAEEGLGYGQVWLTLPDVQVGLTVFSDEQCGTSDTKLTVKNGQCTYMSGPVDNYFVLNAVLGGDIVYGFECDIGTCLNCKIIGVAKPATCVEINSDYAMQLFVQ